MAEAHDKGNALEEAVRAIEDVILRQSPAYNERSFSIQSKQRVRVEGVCHEIDLLVRVSLAPSYDAVFIFECKNWEENVGKNEIIVFSEKVKALQAQKGFFVARSYTKDALAQAGLDPRLELVNVTDLGSAEELRPFGFHEIYLEGPPRAKLTLWRYDLPPGTPQVPIDQGTVLLLNGAAMPLDDYIQQWSLEAVEERLKTFPSSDLPDDTHELSIDQRREIPRGVLVYNGKDLERLELTVTFNMRVVRPPILSNFDVHGRGRVVKFAPTSLGPAEVQFSIVTIPHPKTPNEP